MYYTYLLRCVGGSLYAGITTDLQRRLREHRSGSRGAKYTRAHPPLAYAAAWVLPDRAAASRLEIRLKRLSHAEKEALLAAGLRGYEPVPPELLTGGKKA